MNDECRGTQLASKADEQASTKNHCLGIPIPEPGTLPWSNFFSFVYSSLFDVRRAIMDPLLNGLHIAILVTDGFEQVEFSETKKALEREGAITKIVSNRQEKVQGVNHDVEADQFNVDLTFDEADPADFDGIILPGGAMNAAHLRSIQQAQHFVQGVENQGKPIAAICHGVSLLAAAGLVQGRTLTSWPALRGDISSAGGNWIDQEVVVDGNWVTSRKPDDIPAFTQKMIEVMAGRMRANLRGKADGHAVGIASS
jgi:protease I